MKRIATYGSLRAGYWNHDRYGLQHATRHADGVVKGGMFKSNSKGMWYPFLFKDGECDARYVRDHVVEVYEIPESIFQSIRRMEEGSGYKTETVMVNDVECYIFWAEDDGRIVESLFAEQYNP